ncbi:polysaccharide biosynthesis protein [Bengtsoniella intestinalis]|uniref:putative polysaccharide biosynthesis protein n=1 Tax=Bengtsoniella intestinalis TaxID=3073143 RepID=UPI00391FB927
MSQKESKSSFLGGAAVLATAVVIVKLIGAVYKIPLGNILGSEGNAYFNVAYNIYNVLLIACIAGFPLAVSKLTSQAVAMGRHNERRKLFTTALRLFFCVGATSALVMFFGNELLAEFMNEPNAALAIRTMAPAVFCVAMLDCMRGYTQGQGIMKLTAATQILEAVCKLCVGLSLAYYFLRTGYGLNVAVAGAVAGVTTGTVLCLLVLSLYLFTHRNPVYSVDVPLDRPQLLRRILLIGVPITLSNSTMSVITLVDTKIVLGQLKTIPELADQAATLYGQYTFGINLMTLPSSFVSPVTLSLIPFAAAAMARQDGAAANRIISSAFRLIALLAIPAGVGLSVLAGPLLLMLYPAQVEDAVAAAPHLQVLGIACIFICLMTLSNAVLQSYGKERLPIATMLIGGLVKISMNYVLVGNPEININGAPISTLCCYMTIAGLNLFFVWKYSPQKPDYFALFAKPTVAAVLMGAAAWSACGLVHTVMEGAMSEYMVNALGALIGIGCGVIVYGVLVILLRILQAEDVRALPKGEKLVKLLRLK